MDPCPYRPELPPPPPSIARLPTDRGYPVPWFVAWIDGRPEFRVADAAKIALAVRDRLCWVCGGPLSHRVAYLIGPMCVVNRVSAEPPSHPGCAEYSVRACPFLSRPAMVRREGGLPEEGESPGVMIRRNPGVTCLWTTRAPGATPFRDGPGLLFRLWTPTALSWWCEGRTATRAEVLASVESGLPSLLGMAEAEGPGAEAELQRMRAEAAPLWPVTP